MMETVSQSSLYSVALQYGLSQQQLQTLISAYRKEKISKPLSFGDLLEVLE